MDWRKAPISKLYYEHQEGEEYAELIQGREREGKIRLRHRVEIEGGVLTRVQCRIGEFELVDGNWQEARGRKVRRRVVGGKENASKSAALPDVLSLITAEQFRAITEDAQTAVLIQGIAGSGKTTVALHRLAWLLHHENSELRPEQALLLVRSRALKSYIAQSLPVLDLNGVRVQTLREWSQPTIDKICGELSPSQISVADSETSLSIARLKRSLALLLVLEEYVEEQRTRLLRYFETQLPWGELPEQLKRSYSVLRTKHDAKPINYPILHFLRQLIERFEEHSSASEKVKPWIEQLSSVLRRMELYREDLLRVLARGDQIVRRDETHLLDRSLVTESLKLTEQHFAEGKLSSSDEALLLRLYQLKNGALYQRSESGELILAQRSKHIVIDEVQDFSPPELAVVIGAVEKVEQLTLVGDTAQEISRERTFPGWDKLRSHWNLGGDLSRFISLSVSHRSTLQIMRLADHVLRSGRTSSGREGKAPLWFKCRREEYGVREAIGWLSRVTELEPDSTTAVICRNLAEARFVVSLLDPTFGGAVRLGDDQDFSFDSGVVVSDVAQVKGLEFPNVLIWNPSLKNYSEDPLEQNLLYVAISRAEERLALVTWGRPSVLLPPRAARILRVVEEEVEEPEPERGDDS